MKINCSFNAQVLAVTVRDSKDKNGNPVQYCNLQIFNPSTKECGEVSCDSSLKDLEPGNYSLNAEYNDKYKGFRILSANFAGKVK